jgi:hypothetical protein
MDEQQQEQQRREALRGNGGGRAMTPEELERELDVTRREMNDTMSAIGDKLSPDALMRRAMAYYDIGPKEFATNLGEAVRRNPLPATLAGIGVAWMMWADRHPVEPQPAGPGIGERMAAGAEGVRSAAAGWRARADDAGERLRDSVESGREQGRLWATRAARRGSDLSHAGRQMIDEQPLLVALVGLAVGALVGAAVPRTRVEDRAGAALREKVEASAGTLGEKAEAVVESAAEALHSGISEAEKKAVPREEGKTKMPPPGSAPGTVRH